MEITASSIQSTLRLRARWVTDECGQLTLTWVPDRDDTGTETTDLDLAA